MSILVDKDVKFSNINQPQSVSGVKLSSRQYVVDADGNIIHYDNNNVINAIDIDWNNAQYKDILGPIKSTADLIQIIGETKEHGGNGGNGNIVATDGIPIYNPEMIEEHRANNNLPETYISIGDSRTSDTSLITSLINTVNALQQEVTKLKNTFAQGIYSYNNEATYISSVIGQYGDEQEPLWAIDEGELDEIENLEIPENTYIYTDTNDVIKNCQDCRLYTYITSNNLNINITLKSLINNHGYNFSLNNLINTDKESNVLFIISRKIVDNQYPINFIYISISDANTHTNIAHGYLNLDDYILEDEEFNINDTLYLYSIDASNANASKLKIYSQDKIVGNNVQAEVPGDDEDTYRVAHIAIRSVKNSTILTKVKNKLVNNELVFNEGAEKLYIKINNKLINIGSSGSSPDEPWSDDDDMTNKEEIIKALAEQGIITIHFVNPNLDSDESLYSASNIVDYTFNKVGSVTFVNEDTGKTYEFSADAYGELKGKLIEESTTFESILNKIGKTINNDFESERGFIANFNDRVRNTSGYADRKLFADRIRIGAIYAPLKTDVIHGCSHAYVELENTSDQDYNLSGCSLHIIKFDEQLNYYIKHSLKLNGIIKAGSTYLIRGKKYIINDTDPNCYIHVNSYDQEWYVNKELIDFSISNDLTKSTAFVLTYANLNSNNMLYLLNNEINYGDESQRNYLGDGSSTPPTLKLVNTDTAASNVEGDSNATYVLPAGLIDVVMIGASRYGLINKVNPFDIKPNCIYKNTFELDPAKQAYNGFGSKDSSRVRWANKANDYQYLMLNKEYIEFPKSTSIKYISDYTPKASFENKNVCTDKTKFNPEKPNAVTVSFGENIYTTRCFNWLSGSNNDEYVWIYDSDTLVGKFESYKYTDTDIEQSTTGLCHRKEYPAYVNNIVYCDYRPHTTLDRSRTDKNGNYLDVSYPEFTKSKRACGLFAATNDFYTSHKCVIEFNEISGTKKEYNYIVGQSDKNGNPLEGHCSEVRKFTIYPNNYTPKLYQISDQQGFHWIEYQVWEAAAIKLNEKITNDITVNPNILPIIVNTGDLTQSGSRVNEWLDYFNAGDVLFNHFEQNNIVGNNDLNGTDVQFLGTGDDDGKSNGYYFYLFNCVDVNNFFNDEEDHYPIINNVYVPSLYYFESNDLRFVMTNSEITEVNCRDWFNLRYGEYNVNIYTGYTLNKTVGAEEYAANKTIDEGAAYDKFTPIYTLLWHAFNDTNKKRMVACHEMPFTVITHKCIAENATQISEYRSLSDAIPAALIGCHMNQISKTEKGAGIYWFSRLLESSGVKLCIGGHKHTYAITYPLRENYKYKIKYNKSTNEYEYKNENDPNDFWYSKNDGPMSMGPTLEMEKGNVNWVWAPDATYINKNNTTDKINGDWRLSEYPWFGAEIDNQLYTGNINWSKFPITYRGKNFIEYNDNELSQSFYPCIPKYNFETSDSKYKEHDAYDQYANSAVRYIMCQATGYKLKSNKELPTPRQKFSNIIPKTKPGTGSDTPSNNQLFPMFITYDFENQSSDIHCKVKLGRITNIFNANYKFDQTDHDKGLGISNMKIEYLIDKNQYNDSMFNDITFIEEYKGSSTTDLINNINVYDNYGLWSKVEKQMIDDIIL